MAFFGGNKKKKIDVPATPTTSALNPSTVIYTMPEKFLVAETPKFWNATKIWIVIIVFVLALLGGVYWLVVGLRPAVVAPANPAPAVNAPVSPSSNEPVKAPDTATATNTPTNINVPATTTPGDKNSSSSPSTNPPPITPPILPPAAPTILPKSADSDTDGLTDKEEQMYGTNVYLADSDQDGYPDLSELMNGFNPLGPGKLSETKLFRVFTSDQHDYRASYPASWSARATSDNEDEVDFVASSDELVRVSLQPNLSRLPVLDWYRATPGIVGAASATTETIGQWTGVFTPDQRTFYASTPSRPNDIFVITYNVGTTTQTNYAATFAIMIAHLNVTP